VRELANLPQLRRALPDTTSIVTTNDASNAHTVASNHGFGCTVVARLTEWRRPLT
jgi:hypothetical protein